MKSLFQYDRTMEQHTELIFISTISHCPYLGTNYHIFPERNSLVCLSSKTVKTRPYTFIITFCHLESQRSQHLYVEVHLSWFLRKPR